MILSNIFISLVVFFLGFIFFKKFNPSYSYEAIQKAHIDDVPRIGGILIITSIILMCLKNLEILSSNYNIAIICCMPFLIIALKEDICHDVSTKIRFASLLLSSAALLFFLDIDIYSIQINFLQCFNYVRFYWLSPHSRLLWAGNLPVRHNETQMLYFLYFICGRF